MAVLARLASGVIGSVIAGFAIWHGGLSLGRELSGWSVKQLAARIERRGAPEPGFWDKAGDALRPDVDLTCHNRVGKAQLTLALAALDGRITQGDSDGEAEMRDLAVDLARRNLQCTPLDGNIWLRLGMLEVGGGGVTPDTEQDFDLSSRFAPAEGWVIEQRLAYYSAMARRQVAGFADRARRELEFYVRWGGSKDKALAVYTTAPAILESALRAGINALGPRRQQDYWATADMQGLEIGQPRTGRTLDFNPFGAPAAKPK